MAAPSASGSGIINKPVAYGASSQVTSDNLNQHVDNAVFNVNAVDGITINADSNGKNLFVVDGSISVAKTSFLETIDTTADSVVKILSKQSNGKYDSVTPGGDVTMSQAGAFTIAAGAVEGTMLNSNTVDDSTIELSSNTLSVKDSGITKAKIENVANMKVLGNTSGSAAAPEEVTINDTDDMSDASATTLATSESIKAYVDTNANALATAIYRTVQGRDTGNTIWKNWTELSDPAGLGAYSAGGYYQFASTGTYLIEASLMLEDNDTSLNKHYYPQMKMWNGSSSSSAFYTTNNNGAGSGSDVSVSDFVYYDVTTSAKVTSHFLSLILKVENTTTAQVLISTVAFGGAAAANWEGGGTFKVTKLSSSLI